jgi:hypothetical protein
MGRRRSDDERLNRYHPHNHPMSYNFQRALQQQQHEQNDSFNTVAQYYPKSTTHQNNFPPTNSFQPPRLVSQTNSVSGSRPATYASPPSTLERQDNGLRGQTAPDQSTSWNQNDHQSAKKTPNIRKVIVAVPETDILDDSNCSETEDELVAGCADENHTKDDTINCEFIYDIKKVRKTLLKKTAKPKILQNNDCKTQMKIQQI